MNIIATQRLSIRPENKGRFMDWQGRLNAAIGSAEGFISLEFTIEPDGRWLVSQRFFNKDVLDQWRHSSRYQGLLKELQPLTDDLEEKVEDENALNTGVTEVIITRVQPGQERAYQEWSAQIHKIEGKFPGFRGVYIQSPKEKQGKFWITLLQFDTPENLDNWLNSPERQEILKRSSALTSSLETHRMASSYAGWFYSLDDKQPLPPVWKQTMLVLLVLYPIVMLQLRYFMPLFTGWHPSLVTFFANAVSVTLIAFPMMPLAIFCLRWWLSAGNSIPGTVFICLLYLLEIAIFWNFS